MIRFVTSGESHGPCLTAILEGIPSGLRVNIEDVNKDLARRQIGHGSGKRMEIEKDRVEITSGLRFGITLGTPIALQVKNLDWRHWQDRMAIDRVKNIRMDTITEPRPGHADLAGTLKYDQKEIRNVLERASARETTMRVAVGSICRTLLKQFGIKIVSYVVEIGGICIKNNKTPLHILCEIAEKSVLRCPCPVTEKRMIKLIDAMTAKGDSLGGTFIVVADSVTVGLGSYSQWDLRLDGRLAQALMSIQAIKGVEIGIGFEAARLPGSKVHDEILFKKRKGFYRKTNNAGGIEGGVSNGESIIIRAAMKPIATLYTPLQSVDIITKKSVKATVERSDICRVPSAAVIGEAMVCIELAKAFCEKFGGDSMREIMRNYKSYMKQIKTY